MMTARIFIPLLLVWAAAAQTPVIVISIDTLRADHLSAYGYRALSTPNTSTLAQTRNLYAWIISYNLREYCEEAFRALRPNTG